MPSPASPDAAPAAHRHRSDVQGLRALAVGLVVVDHLWPRVLPGGFVGVDVFFVISGYLITGLLVREAERTGRVSLSGFYARRARRIVPAATLVLVATAALSVLTLALLRAQEVLTDAVWAAFFAANVRMAQTGVDYFAIGQPPSPLRHYWSLAVEEQFYLVWPLVFVVLLARRRGRVAQDPRQTLRRTLLLVAVLAVAASFAWSLWATAGSPTTAYFSSLTRAWELGVGALCALVTLTARVPARVLTAGSVLALVVLGAVALRYDADTAFPGAAAALPVAATAVLLLAGERAPEGRAGVVGRLLSLRPLVAVGAWSYSLYLWHWPLLVLVRSNVAPGSWTLPVQLGVLVAALALSWATFRFVETPLRRPRRDRPRRALVYYPASVALVVLVAVAGSQLIRYQLGGFSDEPAVSVADYDRDLGDDPRVALVRASVLAAQDGRAVPGDLVPGLADLREQTASLGECDYREGTTRLCPRGDPEAGRSIVVVGDSHARALSPALEEIGRDQGYRVYVLVFSGCSATSLQQIERGTDEVWAECEDFKDWARGAISSLDPDLVVVSTASGRYVDPATGDDVGPGGDRATYLDVIESGWRDYLTDLEGRAGRVALVGGTPKLPRETGVCLSGSDPDLGDCAFEPGRAERREAEASFRAARAVDAGVVDAAPWFCADGLCPSVVGRLITMRDSEHMTPDYARWLAPGLAARLGLPGTDDAAR